MHKMTRAIDHLPYDWEPKHEEVRRNIILGDLNMDISWKKKTTREKLLLKTAKANAKDVI